MTPEQITHALKIIEAKLRKRKIWFVDIRKGQVSIHEHDSDYFDIQINHEHPPCANGSPIKILLPEGDALVEACFLNEKDALLFVVSQFKNGELSVVNMDTFLRSELNEYFRKHDIPFFLWSKIF